MERVDQMTSPPVVGQMYLVPCVYVDPAIEEGHGRRRTLEEERIVYPYAGIRKGWWPVTGPRHEDAALLDFPPHHWHFDLRFLGPAQLRNRTDRGTWLDRPFTQPLMCYGGLRGPEYHPRRCMRDLALPAKLQVLRDKLEPHFQDATLRGPCKVCPHKGLPLASLPIGADGTVTCPGHGLRWHVETGKLVRTTGGQG